MYSAALNCWGVHLNSAQEHVQFLKLDFQQCSGNATSEFFLNKWKLDCHIFRSILIKQWRTNSPCSLSSA